jgi:hypothetical protein
MFKGAFHILHELDALSAPFGAVARSPLFDRAIVEIAFMMPPQLKLRGYVEKYVLKDAVRDLLPRAIVERPKSGMMVPVEGWFKGPLLRHARERLVDGLASYRLFDRNYLEALLAGRMPGLQSAPRRKDLVAGDSGGMASDGDGEPATAGRLDQPRRASIRRMGTSSRLSGLSISPRVSKVTAPSSASSSPLPRTTGLVAA